MSMIRKRRTVLTREQRRRYRDVLAFVPADVIIEFDATFTRALRRDRASVPKIAARLRQRSSL
jgi:hypothetical protein